MVKVRQDQPIGADGRVDVDAWLHALCARSHVRDPERLRRAADVAHRAEVDAIAARNLWASGISSFETGLEMAEILADLRVDDDGLVAGLLYRAVRERKLPLERVTEEFGDQVGGLVEGVLRMAAVSALKLSSVPKAIGRPEDQIENVRKMLVALIDDVRVALIKLSERTCAIRYAKLARPERRERVAREVFDVYAPLAHRLGIGHLRWELEDLAFRYLEPEAYKRIASLLKERREAREHYIDEVVETLTQKLEGSGIHAAVSGRPKHIYSIWRKMQRKGIGFEQVYDVRAVRVLVDEVRDCYGALGIVHALWRHIPREFDDYVALPKENGYRSIHTAVIGPEGRTLEVQIRTHEMHEEAELGVCAHWSYKGNVVTDDRSYERKVTWLRQVLEWQEELGDLGALGEALRRDFDQERIYLLTPDGHVVDLAPGATPLDYAYRIHTDLGHRCRAARVDGQIVPLNTELQTGQKVEILSGEECEPSPTWLNPHLGYLRTSRARAKVQGWFRARDRARNEADGREHILRELGRMAIDAALLPQLVGALGFASEQELFAAAGGGDLDIDRLLQVAQGLAQGPPPEEQQIPLLPEFTVDAGRTAPLPEVLGAGQRPVHFAACCTPEPPQAISGWIEAGQVEVHRRDCAQLLGRARDGEGRSIQLRWGTAPTHRYAFDIVVQAYDRAGLLHDVSRVFAAEHIDVLASTTRTDRLSSTATIALSVELDGLAML
ncbi:MAG: bifunctional (p)ppGpp synthetase/guanosine-3',5'-bis(diphosphate) 3'-pyrophosphohydrolase [Pseudomonadales bacterium]|jgi:GTP pyrophosphokinase|nr:bifunctional (p)ppGpp synthetase/guanosine-3',5'-bis(diphosphate) 3'-pyrophosphohydrolase [Pseudomonadales bacterium]